MTVFCIAESAKEKEKMAKGSEIIDKISTLAFDHICLVEYSRVTVTGRVHWATDCYMHRAIVAVVRKRSPANTLTNNLANTRPWNLRSPGFGSVRRYSEELTPGFHRWQCEQFSTVCLHPLRFVGYHKNVGFLFISQRAPVLPKLGKSEILVENFSIDLNEFGSFKQSLRPNLY